MIRFFLLAIAFVISLSGMAKPTDVIIKSPDASVIALFIIGDTVNFSITVDGKTVLAPSPVSMTLDNGTVYGAHPQLSRVTRWYVDETFPTPVYKRSQVRNRFNAMTMDFRGFSIIVRAYDDGVAYRFVSASETPFKVISEQADFTFPEDWTFRASYVAGNHTTFDSQFHNSQENTYTHSSLSEWDASKLAFPPVMVEADNSYRVIITDVDVLNYPGMYLNVPDGGRVMKAVFPGVPQKCELKGTSLTMGIIQKPVSRYDWIAECQPGEVFPWRLVSVTRGDAPLADSDIVYCLATPPEGDFSWVKPGKASWEWWREHNIKGVNFESGFNTATYKYFIDFAAENKLEYILMDGGWAVRSAGDIFKVVPEINLPELVRYGAEKGVGIVLWAGYWAFHKDMEAACRHYSEMGIKGFKVDFQDRDDQLMTRYYREAAAMAAKYHLILDFHGCSKPTGLQRTYPNVLNFEGVYGLETVKFMNQQNPSDLVTYEATIPFIRLFAGSCDYTQGSMMNATKSNFRVVWSDPMSQGTRCRQIAEYVIFYAPFSMMCDLPHLYRAEQECTDFISSIPVVWDETKVLEGKPGEYVVIARRKGDVWYVGAINGWEAMDRTLDLSFLDAGRWHMEIMRDGVNAATNATDYKKVISRLPSNGLYNIHLAPGGGFVARLTPLR